MIFLLDFMRRGGGTLDQRQPGTLHQDTEAFPLWRQKSQNSNQKMCREDIRSMETIPQTAASQCCGCVWVRAWWEYKGQFGNQGGTADNKQVGPVWAVLTLKRKPGLLWNPNEQAPGLHCSPVPLAFKWIFRLWSRNTCDLSVNSLKLLVTGVFKEVWCVKFLSIWAAIC